MCNTSVLSQHTISKKQSRFHDNANVHQGKKENGQRTDCTACEAGKVAKTEGSTECTACSAEGPLYYANSGNTACETCDEVRI